MCTFEIFFENENLFQAKSLRVKKENIFTEKYIDFLVIDWLIITLKRALNDPAEVDVKHCFIWCIVKVVASCLSTAQISSSTFSTSPKVFWLFKHSRTSQIVEKFLTHPQNAEEFPQQQKYFFLTGEIVEPWSSREIVDQMEK